MPNLNETDKRFAEAARRWRLKLEAEAKFKKGAFSNFRVILHAMKKDAFERIIAAGGGRALDVKPPYCKSQIALQATHCFVDGKMKALDDKDRRSLQQAGVILLKIDFIHAYLMQDECDVTTYQI